jgi:hypothetical protein
VGGRGRAALEEPLVTLAPPIPERVGSAALAALAVGGGKVAFPEGLDPLTPTASNFNISAAPAPDVLLYAALKEPLNNKASSAASAPPTKGILVFSGGATDGIAARPCGDVEAVVLRKEADGAGRAGPYDLAESGGVPGGVSRLP